MKATMITVLFTCILSGEEHRALLSLSEFTRIENAANRYIFVAEQETLFAFYELLRTHNWESLARTNETQAYANTVFGSWERYVEVLDSMADKIQSVDIDGGIKIVLHFDDDVPPEKVTQFCEALEEELKARGGRITWLET